MTRQKKACCNSKVPICRCVRSLPWEVAICLHEKSLGLFSYTACASGRRVRVRAAAPGAEMHDAVHVSSGRGGEDVGALLTTHRRRCVVAACLRSGSVRNSDVACARCWTHCPAPCAIRDQGHLPLIGHCQHPASASSINSSIKIKIIISSSSSDVTSSMTSAMNSHVSRPHRVGVSRLLQRHRTRLQRSGATGLWTGDREVLSMETGRISRPRRRFTGIGKKLKLPRKSAVAAAVSAQKRFSPE